MKLEELPEYLQTTLRQLWRTHYWPELRCPYCKTFHRNDCLFYERLRAALRAIDEELADELRKDT